MKVLFLTPWYPSEKDAMLGLFVQKHVEAVRAQGVDVRVIFSRGWIDLCRQWRALKREWGLPDVVQLNVIQKQGLLALWLKKKYKIPYVIVEHFTGYLPENKSVAESRWHIAFMKRICREAEVVMPVSEQLGKAMQSLGFQAKRWEIIDNIVDDFFFDTATKIDKKTNIKTLLNITCFDEPHKNVKGLLRAAKALSEKRQDWRLVLVGTGVDYREVRAYADTLNIPAGLVVWTGELTPGEVAEWMHKSDAFVLSSRYETYGVVLAEAVAAGIPIVSTPVGIAEDVADIIVPQEIAQGDAKRFADYMETVLWNSELISKNNKKVSKDRFSTQAVGKKLKAVYASCMDYSAQ